MDGVLKAGIFLKEHLRQVEPEILRTVYPELWGYEGKYHTVSTDLPFGLKELYQARLDWSGKAVNYGGKATNVPLANIGVIWDKYRTLAGILGVEWGYLELEQQRMAEISGIPAPNTVSEYRAALEKGLREWVHNKTVYGDPSIGFQGLFTGADVSLIDTTTNINTETSRNITEFFRGVLRTFRKTSRLTVGQPSMLVSVDLDHALTQPYVDNGAFADARSPKEFLLQNGVGSINVVNECTNDFLAAEGVSSVGTTKDFFMLYEPGASTLDKKQSTVYTTPVERNQLKYSTVGIVACSEVRFKEPFRIRYYTYPKA